MQFFLEKPKRIDEKSAIIKYFINSTKFDPLVERTETPFYLYWDKVRYLELPEDIEPEELWTVIRFSRVTRSTKSIIKKEDGLCFSWVKLSSFEEPLHSIDLNTGGTLSVLLDDIAEKQKMRFLARGIVEEAIASSQLEGASTTRQAAKRMIREGRKPKTKDEKMILNNYLAMQQVESEDRVKPLTKELILEWHRVLTKDVIDPPDAIGRFRSDEEQIVVQNDLDGTIYHVPPRVHFVEEQFDKFLEFANDKDEGSFLHPIIKAIMLHFWIGYLHPFADGNGRLARLCFYWYLLKHDYWAFSYLPISKIIKRSPSKYKMAFVYSEQDGGDLTYFIAFNIRAICLAIEDFKDTVQLRARQNGKVRLVARELNGLNERQVMLLQSLHENPEELASVAIHSKIHQVARMTAYLDFKKLKNEGFVEERRRGHRVYYVPTEKVEKLFKKNQKKN